MTKAMAMQEESGRKAGSAASAPEASARSVSRIKCHDLFRTMREVEIDHDGRIYRLRLTRHNKLILTA